MNSPRGVLWICELLQESGHQAWLVGGCVRDSLMGRKPHDWDVATDALPDRVASLFDRTVLTGAKHGTVTVFADREPFEVTTFRADGAYSDGRHPDEVRFVSSLEEDLRRRDFTMNAIAFDPIAEVYVDPFEGKDDIEIGLIRAVGLARERFAEDGLRALRAARFAASLGFTVASATRSAIRQTLDSYRKVAIERVQAEWMKILAAPKPSTAFLLMAEDGLLEATVPEFMPMIGCGQNRYHAYDVWTHVMHVLDAAPPSPTVRLAALFHDVCKPECKGVHPVHGDVTFYNHEERGAEVTDGIMLRMRFPNDLRQAVVHLVRHHLIPYQHGWAAGAIRRWVRRVGPQYVAPLLALARADIAGKGPALVGLKVDLIDELERRIGELQFHAPIATSTTALAIKGSDVMRELGIGPGPAVGAKLRELLELVTDQPELNDRDALLLQLRGQRSEVE